MNSNDIKKLDENRLKSLHGGTSLSVSERKRSDHAVSTMRNQANRKSDQRRQSSAKNSRDFSPFRALGDMLGLTIMLEVGDIGRVPKRWETILRIAGV